MRKQLKLPKILVIDSCCKMKSITRINQPTCEDLATEELRDKAREYSMESVFPDSQ